MTRKNRQRVARLATALILFAILPLYVMRLVGEGIVWLMDWCVERRRWSECIVSSAARIVLWVKQ